jgi:hypothetical protein
MKPISILFATVWALILGGCADPLEQTTVQDVQEHFQRGVSGQGHLVPNDSENNQPGRPSALETPPEYPPRP